MRPVPPPLARQAAQIVAAVAVLAAQFQTYASLPRSVEALGAAKATAQAIKGRSTGRSIGVIDTLHLAEVALGIEALRGSKALTPAEDAAPPSLAALDQALAAGATSLKPPEEVFWGGYSGYFADLDGHTWEFVHMVDASKALG